MNCRNCELPVHDDKGLWRHVATDFTRCWPDSNDAMKRYCVAHPHETTLDVRVRMWREKTLDERGPGRAVESCGQCHGTGVFPEWDKPQSCSRCFPENSPPLSYLHPKTSDPEKERQAEWALADEIRASDESTYMGTAW